MSDSNHVVLLVEDNEDDAFLMRRALKKTELPFLVCEAVDGQQALDYLEGIGPYRDRAKFPIPAIIFLDLKLPYLHGFEVLAWLREQPSLKEIPVAVLTSSSEERDRQRARELDAKAYLVKPPTREMLLAALRSVKEPGTATLQRAITDRETLSSNGHLRTGG